MDTGSVGTYVLTYTYIDNAGNSGNVVTRTIYITDQTPAIITLNAGENTIIEGNTYSDPGARRTDAVDGS